MIILLFEPANTADRQMIESFLPKIPEGQTLDLSQLPTSLPGYLIKLKAELKVEGNVVAIGGIFPIGQQVGMMLSALEHWIPELFFTSPDRPGEAVSAVKALVLASAQGQRIYQVSAKNVEAVLPLLKINPRRMR